MLELTNNHIMRPLPHFLNILEQTALSKTLKH